ncbi:MAG: PIN domain-containing protein [Bacteroidetes bacterium]|nr:PIN domain-containing protein [Bacteroidota bacterium]
MVIFDTNTILRYILQDVQDMANMAEKRLSEVVCTVPTEVVAELVYVLNKVYKIDRQIIAKTLGDFFKMHNVSVNSHAVVSIALDVFADTKLDFVDCMLVGYAKAENYEIFTFDKALQKSLN